MDNEMQYPYLNGNHFRYNTVHLLKPVVTSSPVVGSCDTHGVFIEYRLFS